MNAIACYTRDKQAHPDEYILIRSVTDNCVYLLDDKLTNDHGKEEYYILLKTCDFNTRNKFKSTDDNILSGDKLAIFESSSK